MNTFDQYMKNSYLNSPCFETICLGLYYDFKIYAGPSTIPNAGNGAFIMLIRVRKMPSRGRKEKQNRVPENFSLTQLSLTAILDTQELNVRLGPSYIHDFSDVICSESILDAATTSFCSCEEGNGSIWIGKYGPFHESDIKTEFLYDVKNFLFDSEPSVWSYGLSNMHDMIECINNLEHDEDGYVLDITSDHDGNVHAEARKHIPMYVNEVGHNLDLRPNVTPRDEKSNDDIGVSYYFFTDRPIYVGEIHELLVNYQDGYEETRERKGYGKSGAGSDHDDQSARVRRNMSTRLSIEDKIKYKSHARIMGCLRDIEIMSRPIIRFSNNSLAAKCYISNDISNDDVAIWVARFRLSWVVDMFSTHRSSVTDDFKSVLQNMSFMPYPIFCALLESNEKLLNAYQYELLEENIFLASKGQLLIHPMDGSLFCPIAREIVMYISHVLTFNLRSNRIGERVLIKGIYELAVKAATEIRKLRQTAKREMMVNRLGFRIQNETLAHHTLVCDLPWRSHVSHILLKCASEKNDKNLQRIRMIKKNEYGGDLHELDEDWYLLFQLVKVIHVMTTKCFVGIEKYGYSLSVLCKLIGVSCERARDVVSVVMEEPYGETFQLFATENEENLLGPMHRAKCKRSVPSKSTDIKISNFPQHREDIFSRYWKVERVYI